MHRRHIEGEDRCPLQLTRRHLETILFFICKLQISDIAKVKQTFVRFNLHDAILNAKLSNLHHL